MALHLSFAGRSRMWAELVQCDGQRIFVPTTERFTVGQVVAVEVEAPELWAPLTLSGKVEGLRPLSGRFPAGIFVTLDVASLARAKQAVGASKDETARLFGRAEPRYDCALQGRLVRPVALGGLTVKSLAQRGLAMHATVPLLPKSVIRVAVTLPSKVEIELDATVMWSRPDLQLVGLRFEDVSADAAAHLSQALAAMAAVPAAPSSSASGYTVVVADDDPAILEFLSRLVTEAGHRVVRAERGDAALEVIRAELPRLVFLDVLMPGIDGLELCRALRADAALSVVPVVLLSAMGEDRLVQAANDAGANDYLTKPVRLEAVRALLEKYCRYESGVLRRP